jgi:hypothetical protein
MLYIRTIDEIRAMLGIADTRDDGAIVLWAEGLQGRFDDHCRRVLLREAAAVELHQGGSAMLYLLHYPVETVHSITIDGVAISVPERVDRMRGRISGGLHGWDEGEIALTVTGGLIQADGTRAPLAPAGEVMALKRAFDLQLNYEWRNRKTLGIAQVSQQGASMQAPAMITLALAGMTLLAEVESTLQPLRRML